MLIDGNHKNSLNVEMDTLITTLSFFRIRRRCQALYKISDVVNLTILGSLLAPLTRWIEPSFTLFAASARSGFGTCLLNCAFFTRLLLSKWRGCRRWRPGQNENTVG
jgi:hypothetical protein